MKNIEQLWAKGKDFLGTKYAVMGGAMSWISESNLVSSISNAGGFGVIACGSMDKNLLSKQIRETKAKTNKPFGVNLVVLHPEIESLIQACVDEKVSHVILAAGLPSSVMLTKLHENNIKIISFAPNLAVAKRLIRNGVDALIIEGSEAGGHIGPVATSVLVQEVLLNITEVPIFVAGGIGKGEVVANYLELGASGVQVGTLLVCSPECIAHDNFKQAFIKASSRDAQATVQIDPDFAVVPVRAIQNQGSKEFIEVQKKAIAEFKEGKMSKSEAQLQIELYWTGSLRNAVINGDITHGSLMAGQCVGLVKETKPVKKILDDLIKEAEDYLAK